MGNFHFFLPRAEFRFLSTCCPGLNSCAHPIFSFHAVKKWSRMLYCGARLPFNETMGGVIVCLIHSIVQPDELE